VEATGCFDSSSLVLRYVEYSLHRLETHSGEVSFCLDGITDDEEAIQWVIIVDIQRCLHSSDGCFDDSKRLM